jgi:cytochrome c oxidase subunit IV
MSTVIEPTPTIHEGHEESSAHVPGAHKSTIFYVKVALVLGAMTALETSTYWLDYGKLFMPLLLIMMVAKFFTVVSLFMHLKYDNKLFAFLFYSGLILALMVYIGALATFKLFVGT